MNTFPTFSITAICLTALFFFSCGYGTTDGSQNQQQVTEISILALDSLNAAYPDAILLDVRSDEEWAAGHLQGASFVSFDWDNRNDPLSGIPWDRTVFVYCEAGGRSGVITEELRIIGHPHIIDLIGGMERWMENKRPLDFDVPVPLAHGAH
jgi:rhodanese-related sulfurtransferase